MSAVSTSELIKFGPISTNKYIYQLTLNDDKTRNCLSHSMIDSLTSTFNQASNIKSCKVILLNTNEQANVFCSGHDLKNFHKILKTKNENQFKEIFNSCDILFKTMNQCNIPIIALLNGIVTASGIELASFCDIILCTESTKFSIPGTLIGLAPFTPTINFVRNLNNITCINNGGYKKIGLEMLFTGNNINANDAYKHGFINKICKDYQNMLECGNEYAIKIAEKSDYCLKNGKKFFYEQIDIKDINYAYKIGEEYMVKAVLHKHLQEGIKAFFEKRKPDWSLST